MNASPYDPLGDAGIGRLVERIYHWMTELPEAEAAMRLHRPDMGEAKRRLAAFLSGSPGGPGRFRAQHGEPSMWRRHMAFPIDSATRDAWMAAFRKALDEVEDEPALLTWLLARFRAMADHLRNRADPGAGHAPAGCGCGAP